RAIARLGGESIATGFLGGVIGKWIDEGVRREGVRTDFVWVRACTRTSTTVRCDSEGIETHLVEPGEPVTEIEERALEEKVAELAHEGDVVILCGSLPPGVRSDFYRRCVERVQSKGAIAFVDAGGAILRETLPAQPRLINPNEEELATALDLEFQSEVEVIGAIEDLLSHGLQCIIVSQGERGAIGADRTSIWRAVPPPVRVVNTVGSGDAMLGGLAYAYHQGMSLAEMLRWGVAAGTANVLVDGPCYFDREDAVEIHKRVRMERIA
ncbi:MAG TPA: 1-phosphofructokinase family hexose kinase, partial [Armatimonadetes bacterium]|nr:1-phosphofructokinase family hexose kinase [Armatimonadota bacterium]